MSRLEAALAGAAAPPQAAPAASSAPAAPAAAAAGSPKRAIGAVRSERAARAADAPATEASAESAPVPEPEREAEPADAVEAPAPPPVAPAVTGAAFDLDDVVLAWSTVLPDLPMATRSQVQHAQPIEVDGDVVVFGVAPGASVGAGAVQDRGRRFEARPRAGPDAAVRWCRPALTRARGRPLPPPNDDAAPVGGAPGDRPADFVDAERQVRRYLRSTCSRPNSGATVVERPRQ